VVDHAVAPAIAAPRDDVPIRIEKRYVVAHRSVRNVQATPHEALVEKPRLAKVLAGRFRIVPLSRT